MINANALIHAANEFKDKPKGQYVLVYYDATYIGTDRTADIGSDLTWQFTGTDKQVYDTANEVTPLENASAPTEARKGGTVHGQAVFGIAPRLIHGGTLTVQAYDANLNQVYADFAIS